MQKRARAGNRERKYRIEKIKTVGRERVEEAKGTDEKDKLRNVKRITKENRRKGATEGGKKTISIEKKFLCEFLFAKHALCNLRRRRAFLCSETELFQRERFEAPFLLEIIADKIMFPSTQKMLAQVRMSALGPDRRGSECVRLARSCGRPFPAQPRSNILPIAVVVSHCPHSHTNYYT